jgi:CMP-N,N'-diacetyllegionaminic acid synthase
LKPICLIAARGGSKGVKNKNTRMIAGKPLIAHTIEKAINSKIFQHVIVSSEDSKIISIAKKFGAEVPFIRPKKLAIDSANMNDVLIHAIKKLYSLNYKFDIIVNRDCTVPFIQNKDIRNSIKLLKHKKCDVVFGAYKQHHNPYFNMMESNKKGFLEFSKKLKNRVLTRQSAPIVYQLNGLFTIDVKKFLKYQTLIMPKILPYQIQPETGWMIDTEFEFKVAEMIFKTYNN